MQYSQNEAIINVLKNYFEGFYRLLIEVDWHNKSKEKADRLYGVICSILINIVSYQEIDFAGEVPGDLASPIIENIKNREREIDTLWFIANILYRKNTFSSHFMNTLVKINIFEYVKKRIGFIFQRLKSPRLSGIYTEFIAMVRGWKDYPMGMVHIILCSVRTVNIILISFRV